MKERIYTRYALESSIDITALYTAFFQDMQPDQGSQGEFHNFWEMVLVLDGQLEAATEHSTFSITKNHMIIHPPMEFHRHFNHSDRPARIAILSFDAARFPTVNNSIFPFSEDHILTFTELIHFIRQQDLLSERSDDVANQQSRFSKQITKLRLELLLLSVLTDQTLPRMNNSPDYMKIVSYLSANLHRNLTLEIIAEELNMSVSNLKLIFSKYAGMGVIHYFNQQKIHKATALLKTGRSVREISEMLGYSSQSAFSTSFKTITGFPPSAFRNAI